MIRAVALRSLAFAFVAGLGTVPALLVLVPLLGRAWAWSLLLLALLVLYVAAVAPSPRRALLGVGVALPLGLAALVLGSGAAALGCAVVLALCRSLLLYRQRPLRALWLEGMLVVVGLLFAGQLFGSSALAAGLAVWGFFLMQSLYFIVGGLETRPQEGTARDPFERAARRLQEALGEVGLG